LILLAAFGSISDIAGEIPSNHEIFNQSYESRLSSSDIR
jgi:hypothetical protein